MKVYTVKEIREAAYAEYPRATIQFYDRDRHVISKEAWNMLHADFIFDLRKNGLEKYGMGAIESRTDQKFEINDCDDYMVHFMSYVSKRHALTQGVTHSLARLGLLYSINGDPARGHAAVAPFFLEDGVLVCRALEPQPNGGIFKCTDPERFSAYSLWG